jgi:hypothetical protein
MRPTNYFDLINRIRVQQGWSWQELASRLDLIDGLSTFPTPVQNDSRHSDSYEEEDVIDAEVIDPPGPGVNPLAVAVDVLASGGQNHVEIYRPYYDEHDELGRAVNFCPFSGIRLQRSCTRCGSSLPRTLELHIRFCGTCGSTLPLNVTLSDIKLHNYWVIYRTDHSPIQLKRYFSFPPSHAARQILTSIEPYLNLPLNGDLVRLTISWRGAARVQPVVAA